MDNQEIILGKMTTAMPLIHSPPFAYSSELIRGQKYQEKMFLRMVATSEGLLYYDATTVVPLHRSPFYEPTGFSLQQITDRDINYFLAKLVDLNFGDKVEPALARTLNFPLYQKLERVLLPRKTPNITELLHHDRSLEEN